MSLVGTRPILPDELEQYELHHRARIAIKPGITGMWQVSGRSDITDFEEIVRLDAIGVLVPWAMSLSPAVFNYIVGPYALRIIWGQFRPVIFVALFAFALFKLMQTESEKKVAVAVEADNDKIKYYKGLGIECEPIRVDDYTGKKMTFFHDPDGLPLELHE